MKTTTTHYWLLVATVAIAIALGAVVAVNLMLCVNGCWLLSSLLLSLLLLLLLLVFVISCCFCSFAGFAGADPSPDIRDPKQRERERDPIQVALHNKRCSCPRLHRRAAGVLPPLAELSFQLSASPASIFHRRGSWVSCRRGLLDVRQVCIGLAWHVLNGRLESSFHLPTLKPNPNP